MKKGRMEFSGTGGKFCTNVNVKLFCYINSNCAFSKTIKKKRCSIESDGTDKKGPLKIQRIFIDGKWQCSIILLILLHKLKLFMILLLRPFEEEKTM